MGRKEKKGERGNVVKYISRAQALKKLQISLAQFRRLCILKGIYPVEPKNKRQLNKGSTLLRTFYYRKDIQFLLHEPVLRTFREQRSHQLKINKAIGKREFVVARSLSESKPVYTLDHIIKERYPSFVDALRDLDDALSMIFLFATLPVDDKIRAHHVRECQRLSAEFQHYVMSSRSLRKVFVSIKGIYYQAEIRGQTITWVTPFQFAQLVPTNVDFRVMATFLEIYETLVGFVNYKLYSDMNIVYPPKVDLDRDASAGGLTSYILESRDRQDIVSSIAAATDGVVSAANAAQIKETAKRIKSLEKKLNKLRSDADEDKDEDEDAAQGGDMDVETDAPVPVAEPTTAEETVPTLVGWNNANEGKELFSSCVFWLSREVPRYSLEFVVKSFGGQIGWDATSGAGSPFDMSDPRITHHICDRPVEKPGELPAGVPRFESREYIQPQWIYDCVNAQRLVKTAGYHPGETLPPHLSPFVTVNEGDYVPDEEDAEQDEDEEMDEGIEDTDEATRQAELEAEAAGVHFSDYAKGGAAADVKEADAKPSAAKGKKQQGKKQSASSEEQAQEAEALELAKKMMSKKHKKLYDRIQSSKEHKSSQADKLRAKKAALKKQAAN
ncbi:mRNA-binding ribosome synthesis protein nop7 [Polyrhizophydium stewartii]|uniref:Pescadillo homolog n=1 Tax=Polyrhizophydium stewartii TaxID=2732419 RepID=A0ABR4N2D6_9FUNG|nr:mRNA-binding ribosome synthesis protein nop7 [Polyrhizophydium stewartii]